MKKETDPFLHAFFKTDEYDSNHSYIQFVKSILSRNIILSYESITVFNDYGLAIFMQDGKYGVVNILGKIILKPIYEKIFFKNDLLLVNYNGETVINNSISIFSIKERYHVSGGKWGVFNRIGENVIPLLFEKLDFAGIHGFVAKKKSKWGILDSKGTIIINFKYDFLSYLKDDLFIAGKKLSTNWYNSFGVIDIHDNIIVPINNLRKQLEVPETISINKNLHEKYSKIYKYEEEFVAVLDRKTSLWGVINQDGDVVTKTQYNRVLGIQNGICIVEKNNKIGAIDINNNIEVIPINLNSDDFRLTFHGDVFVLTKWDKNKPFGVAGSIMINLDAKSITKRYDFIDNSYNGMTKSYDCLPNLLFVCENDKVGYINHFGRIVLSIRYDGIIGRWVKKNLKWGFWDGRSYSSIIFDYEHTPDCLINKYYNKYGIINILPCIYDLIYCIPVIFQIKLFVLKINNKLALYNPVLNIFGNFIYDSINEKNSFADLETIKIRHYNSEYIRIPVKRDGKYGFIDELSHEIINCEYDNVSYFRSCCPIDDIKSFAKICKNNKFGIIYPNGDIAVDCIYDEIDLFTSTPKLKLDGMTYIWYYGYGEIVTDKEWEKRFRDENDIEDYL